MTREQLLAEALTLASSGSGPAAAAKLADAGYPTYAQELNKAWVDGASPTDLYKIVASIPPVTFNSPEAKTDMAQLNELELANAAPVQTSLSNAGGFNPLPTQFGTAPPPSASLFGDIIRAVVPGGQQITNIGNALGGVLGIGGGSATPGIAQPAPQPAGGTDIGAIIQDLITGGAISVAAGAATGQYSQPGTAPAPATNFAPGFAVAATKPGASVRLTAPKGFVIVTIRPNDPYFVAAVSQGGVAQPDGSVKLAMRKEVARKMGYYKPRAKPLLTASQRRTIRKAETLKRKVAQVAKSAGVSCTMPRKRR